MHTLNQINLVLLLLGTGLLFGVLSERHAPAPALTAAQMQATATALVQAKQGH